MNDKEQELFLIQATKMLNQNMGNKITPELANGILVSMTQLLAAEKGDKEDG